MTRIGIKSSSSDSRNPTGADISLVTSLLAATGARQPHRFKREFYNNKLLPFLRTQKVVSDLTNKLIDVS